MFLTEMLAYCFPVNAKSQANDDKLDRIVSRLKSTVRGPDSSPLSVHYEVRSQEIVQQRQNLGACLGQFYELVLMEGSNYLVKDDALHVGSFLFEYDSEYIQFIDKVLLVLFPQENRECSPSYRDSSSLSVFNLQQSSCMQLSNNVCSSSPLLSHFLANVEQEEVKTDVACWEQVLPLLEFLYTWILTAVPPGPHSVSASRRRKSRSKTHESKPANEVVPSLKVNLSRSLVLECLKQREDHYQNSSLAKSTVNLKVHSDSMTEECSNKSNVKNSKADDSVESCANLSSSGPPLLLQLPPGTLKVCVLC